MVDMDASSNNEKPLHPIIEAIKAGDLDTLRRCLKKGENILDVRDGKETALHAAAKNGTYGKICISKALKIKIVIIK